MPWLLIPFTVPQVRGLPPGLQPAQTLPRNGQAQLFLTSLVPHLWCGSPLPCFIIFLPPADAVCGPGPRVVLAGRTLRDKGFEVG